MPWYSGPTLLEVLETVEIQRVVDTQPMRFPVQYVNRPNLDFRGFGHHCVRRGEGGPAREGAAVRCGIGHCPNRHL